MHGTAMVFIASKPPQNMAKPVTYWSQQGGWRSGGKHNRGWGRIANNSCDSPERDLTPKDRTHNGTDTMRGQ